MSEIVTTELGRFRRVTDGARHWFLYECPLCGEWLPLTERQLEGREYVPHVRPPWQWRAGEPCELDSPQRFGAELVARMQARILTGESPIDPESEAGRHE